MSSSVLSLSLSNVGIQAAAMLFNVINLDLSEANKFDSFVELMNLSHLLDLLSGHGTVVLDQSLDSSVNISKGSSFLALVHLDLSKDISSHLLIFGNKCLFSLLVVVENCLGLLWLVHSWQGVSLGW